MVPSKETVTYYVCDNCPKQPKFVSLEELHKHWSTTHTVDMVQVEHDPWNERAPRTKPLFHKEEIAIDG